MKSKLLKVILVLTTVLIVGAVGWRFTFGNATWHLHHIFPGARAHFDYANSPDPSFSTLIRLVVPDYVERSELMSFEVADHPTPIDFARLSGFQLLTIHLTRCKVSDLQPLERLGQPLVIFTDCDLSQLPADQRSLLSFYDPNAAQPERKLAYSSP